MKLSLQRPKENSWEINSYIWLENVGDKHLLLHLTSGDLRLDKGRKYRFQKSILDDPQIHTLLDDRKLEIKEA